MHKNDGGRILRPPQKKEAKSPRAFARRALALAMAVVLSVGNVLGMFAPAVAYAGDSYTHTFDNGQSVQVHSNGTITGYATLSGNWYDRSAKIGRYGNMIMPDGTVLKAECYEVYIGNPNHSMYNVPADGTYPFTATPQPDGGYFILMHTENAKPVPGHLVDTGLVQRTYTTKHWFVALTGSLQLVKESANPSITNGNSCYSLAGAEFSVSDAGGKSVGTLKTGSDGKSNALDLPQGTYTVKETKAPEGYRLNGNAQTVTVKGGKTSTVTFKDEPANDPVSIILGKYDGEKTYIGEGNLPQGSASLAGAEFTVEYYDTLKYGDYDALKKAGEKPTRSWVVRTNANGFARLDEASLVSGDDFYYIGGSITLPRGTVVIYESKAPDGYKLGDVTKDNPSFQRIQENPLDIVATFSMPQVPEPVKRGGVTVQKADSQIGTTPQGDANLKGIEFSIINDNENDVIVDGKSYAKGKVVKTIVTDDKGVAKTADDALPYGSYIIRESKTNDGYLNTASEMKVTVSEDGKVYSFTASDDVVRGGVKVSKRDLESGLPTPLGGASIDGTQFEIKTQSDRPVIVDNVAYTKGQVVKTITVKDGEASTAADALPYGTYTLQEVKSGEGYHLTDGNVYKFSIRENGTIVNPVTGGVVKNQVKRGDFEFTKKADDSADRLANVPFKVTSKTTGESHVIVTDENGYFSSASSWNKHTAKTNANDWALDEKDAIDSSKLDAEAGVWFGKTADGGIVKANDKLGALPYDTYSIDELSCTSNEGYQLVHTTLSITRDGAVIDFGTLDDKRADTVTIATRAYDASDNDNLLGMGHVRIADKVTYDGLIPGRQYKLKTTLHDAKTGDAIPYVGTETAFTAKEASGYEVVQFDVSLDDVYNRLNGSTVTVYEELYSIENGSESLVAKHTDADDVDQQLRYVAPEIGSEATDAADGDKFVSADDKVSVTDTVFYKNLIPGQGYCVLGLLVNKDVYDEYAKDNGPLSSEQLAALASKGAKDMPSAPDGLFVAASGQCFVPEKADGSVDVTFTLDTRDLKEDTQLVALDVLFMPNVQPGDGSVPTQTLIDAVEDIVHRDYFRLAVHADVEDMRQTVTVKHPHIATTALDGIDKDKNVVTDDKSVIVDTVEYRDLNPGQQYILDGQLYVKGTKKPLEVGGEPVKGQTVFTPETSNGSVNVSFEFDSRSLKEGTELVVYESLSRDGKEVASHKDIDDVKQMVVVTAPHISTVALDGADKDKNVVTDDESVIVDTVGYQNLIPGREYVLDGQLYSKKSKKPLEVDGEPVTAQTTFTPEAGSGTVDVTFTFDARGLKDKTDLVVYESLKKDGVEIASHKDIKDANQTVTVIRPSIGTTAKDGVDGDQAIVTDNESQIVDTVEYHNLVPGKTYVVKGTLHVKKTDDEGKVTEEELLDAEGNPVTSEAAFTPDRADGKVDVTFTFDTRSLKEGTEIVVFESLEKNGVELAAHADVKDRGQTVTVTHPEIGTTASDGVDGDKTIVSDDETEIIDTVEYTGLIPGKAYVVKGTLHVKKTDDEGEVTEEPLLDAEGNPVTSETSFTPKKADGKVDVVFHIDSRLIPHNTEVVAFESLEREGVEIAVHADVKDKGQTVKVKHPIIKTSALDGIDGDKNIVTDDESVIVDTVKYTGLIPDKEYTLKGTMYSKKSEKPLEVDGEPVTAQTTFTPEAEDGEVEVTFTFDTRSIEDKTDLVVYESLEREGVEIASHKDIDDEKQTTTVTHPEIGTTAKDGHDGDKDVVTDREVTIVDTVEYKNLIPGKEYTVKGTLHVKKTDDEGKVTEEELKVDGKPVTAETTFIPEEPKGFVDVTFTFDGSAVEDGTEIVAFESLEKKGVELAAHADIEDEDQTTTAHVTGIGTTATDTLDGDKTVIADAETSITDTVEYENALTGTGYTMSGILMDAETGLPILTGDGSENYTEADVAAFMQHLIDALGLTSDNVVGDGFIDVPYSHEGKDGVEKAQSVRVYADGTYEVVTSEHGLDEDGLTYATVDASGKVAYDDLADEQKAAVEDIAVLPEAGVILDYSGTDGLPADIDMEALNKLLDDNADLISHLVYQSEQFTPEKYDGTVSMDFAFDANDVIDRISGETKDIVVFEMMFKGSFDGKGNPVIVASECDLDSEEQTVKLTPTVIGTTATDKSDGDHVLMAGKDAVITDHVEYEGLVPGKEYTLKATLMDKATGEPLSVADQHVTAELKFTPNSQNGSVDIDLGKFDASRLDGHDLVVFEELCKQTTPDEGEPTEVLVAEHKDIDDEDQTVSVTTTPPGGFFGKTGGSAYPAIAAVAVLVVLAGGCAYYGIKTRKGNDAGGDSDEGGSDGKTEA